MRRGDRAPRDSFHHAKWHDWFVCRSCGGVVEDWALHQPCPSAELAQLMETVRLAEKGGYSLEEAAARSRQEAAAEVSLRSFWRGGVRQVVAMFRADFDWIRARFVQ